MPADFDPLRHLLVSINPISRTVTVYDIWAGRWLDLNL